MKYAVLVLFFLSTLLYSQNVNGIVSGHVSGSINDSLISNVNITALSTNFGTTTDSLGNFKLILPVGLQKLKFSYVGYESKTIEVNITNKQGGLNLKVSLDPKILMQGEVNVTANKENLSPTVQEIKEKDLDKMPTVYSDIIRSVKILPGVTSNNELSSSYNVRGGNFDENLIYLNGYEIYRPFLLQQGIEESQSIVNQDLVDNIHFYNGAFPANFGDKMSSVLEVDYKKNKTEFLTGEARADLLNLGLSLHDSYNNFNWSAGFRYAYPSLFSNTLQTKGNYNPSFIDFQLLIDYDLSKSSQMELFILNATNKFDLTPENWKGHFQTNYLDVKEVSLEYSGSRYYSFRTGLYGLKLKNDITDNSKLETSIAFYTNKEEDNKNLSDNVYYSEDAYNPGDNKQYLKTHYEFGANSLNIDTYEFKSDYSLSFESNKLIAGIKGRISKMNNVLDESSYETGTDSVLDSPYSAYAKQNVNFNSLAGYLEDNIFFSNIMQANVGVRLLKYYYNGETLISPRAGLYYNIDDKNILSFNWGFYYQPPYYYELRDKNLAVQKPLLSQKAVHYVLSWENTFDKDMKFSAEVYYKKLSNLIPYYLDQLKLVYSDANSAEGYAYGLDLQYKGELVEGMKTWIGYSYLNTKERDINSNSGYKPRLLDQSHTIRIFLQDKIRKMPNFQSHVRFLFGSGYLYYPRISVTDPSTGETRIVVDYNHIFSYPFYFRVDMGLTFKFNIQNDKNIILTAEVLNIFNKYNVASYSWYHVFPDTKQPVGIPNVFSKRFFNLGVELKF